MAVLPATKPVRITASGSVYNVPAAVAGVFVSSASGTPTIKVWDNTSAAGTVLIDTFTPAASTFYDFRRGKCAIGVFVTIGGTVSCTFFIDPKDNF